MKPGDATVVGGTEGQGCPASVEVGQGGTEAGVFLHDLPSIVDFDCIRRQGRVGSEGKRQFPVLLILRELTVMAKKAHGNKPDPSAVNTTNDAPVFQWKIERRFAPLTDLIRWGLHRFSTGKSLEMQSSPWRMIAGSLVSCLVMSSFYFFLFLSIPQLIQYGIGCLIGHKAMLVISLVICILLLLAILVLGGIILKFNLALLQLEDEFEFVKLRHRADLSAEGEITVGTIAADQLTIPEMFDQIEKMRRKMRQQIRQFCSTLSNIFQFALLGVVSCLVYVYSSPASFVSSGVNENTHSLGEWQLAIADLYVNILLFDCPNTLFGNMSSIEASTWYSRLVVFLLRLATLSSVVVFLFRNYEMLWAKAVIFVGTEDELKTFLVKGGRFEDRSNLVITREYELGPIFSQLLPSVYTQ